MEKARNWTLVFYPESAPSDYFDILQATGLPFAISPLHDHDINPNGETKKPHYHCIVCFPGPTTFSQVQKIAQSIGSNVAPKQLLSIVGMYRYFTHLDNPEKYQYNVEDIRVSNGFDIANYSALTTSQTVQILKTIQQLVQNRKIYEYSTLMDFLLKEDMFDLYQVACTHTLFINHYISSRRHAKEEFDKIILQR